MGITVDKYVHVARMRYIHLKNKFVLLAVTMMLMLYVLPTKVQDSILNRHSDTSTGKLNEETRIVTPFFPVIYVQILHRYMYMF